MVIIKIPNDVDLSLSSFYGHHLKIYNSINLTIAGSNHHGPTDILCHKGASLTFINCTSVLIQDLQWIGCGWSKMLRSKFLVPAGIFFDASHVTIRNCLFKGSRVHTIAVIRSILHVESSNFTNNNGSALYVSDSSFTLSGNIVFSNNNAISGAAIFADGSRAKWQNAMINFTNNSVETYGGAIYVSVNSQFCVPSLVPFINNTSNSSVTFLNNYARTSGNSWYIDINANCKNLDYQNKIFKYLENFNYYSNSSLTSYKREVGTTVFYINLQSPARCNNNGSNCTIDNLMLGEEVVLSAQAVGYYNTTTSAISRFYVSCVQNCDNYYLSGNNVVLIQGNKLRGFSIMGKQVMPDRKDELYVTLKLVVMSTNALASNNVKVNTRLLIKLSACWPGFQHSNASKKCVCYDYKSVVKCENSNAMIKQGFWFGVLKGKHTLTFCPVGYCDFMCNSCFGYCTLLRAQDGQCAYHRTGPACGRCKHGYVLPYDSTECIPSSNCSTGITVLVIVLTVFFWFAMVIVIMIILNFSFQIGYFYSIIYFYSIVDLLFNGFSGSELLFVKVLSGFAKLTPKFLGTMCFVKSTEWSGIDQQFLHYIHPISVLGILVSLAVVARHSPKFSKLISRSIVRAICLILLLQYTSIASTSLQLLRPLFFVNVQGVYTYTSPNICYFCDRHIIYGSVAVFFEVTIAIGFPFLLLLEPFLSSKINFARVRPLLDQYQGCYKDKYRYFAAFYLLCRHAIILTIYLFDNHYYGRYILLGVFCVVFIIIHGWILPYKKSILNKLDLIVLITAAFIVSFNTHCAFTSFNRKVVMALIVFPLFCFVLSIVVFPVIKTLVVYYIAKRRSARNTELEALMSVNSSRELDD